jgi:hypothetical protein
VQADHYVVVILCDPALSTLSPAPNQVVKGKIRIIENVRETLMHRPFQDGYKDILPRKRFKYPPTASDLQCLAKIVHPRVSMLSDLIYYYKNHSALLTPEEWKAPHNSALFLKKIVAAHYIHTVNFVQAVLPSLDPRSSTTWAEEQNQRVSLQSISRLCGAYSNITEDILFSLGYSLDGKLDGPLGLRVVNWKDCEKDFQYIHVRLKGLKVQADDFTTSTTGLSSIAGHRQSREEAIRNQRINVLTLVFVPLAYTSSLFSMQDNYGPST